MIYSFDEILEIKNGKSHKAVENPEGKYPIYGSGGIMGYADDYICGADTVIIGRKGSINNPIYVEVPFWNVDTAFGLEAKRDLLCPRYLFYFCMKYDFEKLNKTVTIPSLTKSDLLKIKINLPKLDIQEGIVKRLDILQKMIDLRKGELESLNVLIKARFVEMFGKGGFPQVTIADLVEKKISTAKNDFAPNDIIKYIDISSIDNKRNLMTGYTKYILSEAPSRAQQHILKDDILISTVRPNLRNVAITSYDDNNIVASSGFCVLRAKKCLPSYLMAIACSNEFTDAMSKVVTGANYPAIKDSDVMKYRVSSPPIELQIEFERFTKQVDKSKFVVLSSS